MIENKKQELDILAFFIAKLDKIISFFYNMSDIWKCFYIVNNKNKSYAM